MRRVGTIALLVLLAAVGVTAGVVGSFVHDFAVDVLGLGLPVGLVLALGLAAAAYLLAGWTMRNRLAVLAAGAGWLVPVLTLSMPRPEGDLVVAANLTGYVFLLGGSILVGLAVVLPYGSRESAKRPVR